MLDYAIHNVMYYKNLYSNFSGSNLIEFYEQLPQLQKTEILHNIEDHTSNEYKKFPQNRYIDVHYTSGSTGHYLKVLWDRREHLKSSIYLARMRYNYYGIIPEDKSVSFFTSSYYGNRLVRSTDFKLNFNGKNIEFCKINLTENRLYNIINMIHDFDPVWFNLQPSIALILADTYTKYRYLLPKSLRYIELSGEYLTTQVRVKLESIFHVPIVNLYGCTEANALAFECPYGHLHCLYQNALIEVYQENKSVINQEGNIVITSFINHAMPFIKYAIGDKGRIIIDKNCSCGLETPIIELKYGRENSYILLKNGMQLNVYVLIHIIELANEQTNGIIEQFQIIQEKYDKLTIQLVIKNSYENWKLEIESMFFKFIAEEKAFSDIQWQIKYVQKIYPNEETGKVNNFVQLIREE